MCTSAGISWPLATERVTIRPATAADTAPTWRYRRLPAVFEWLPRAATTFEGYGAAFVESPRLERTLIVEHHETVVGDLYLHLQDAWTQAEVAADGASTVAEVGWVLDPAHGGRGLATEAVAALVQACFVQLGVRRVRASCIADNTPSWRLMERLGMRREGHGLEESLHRTKGWLDGYHYAVLAAEWDPHVRRSS
jgi:RimJ/RimL family protein N-acetyltransferase